MFLLRWSLRHSVFAVLYRCVFTLQGSCKGFPVSVPLSTILLLLCYQDAFSQSTV